MAGTAAIKKNKLSVLVEGEERNMEVTECRITNDDRDSGEVTFAESEVGSVKDWYLEGVALQFADDPDSIFSLLFSSPGSEVDVIFNPYKSVAAGPTTPWYTGTVTVNDDNFEMGGEADGGGGRQTTPFKWKFLAKPVADTSP